MPDRPLLVVFDTCTHPEYYRDVHRLLALPRGAILRYDYKRYLFSQEAGDLLNEATEQDTPIDAILIYGQHRNYAKGDSDNALSMLSWNSGVFIPTRSAWIVNVAITPGAVRDEDKIHFHLEMRGFVDPATRAVEPLIHTLESRNELPFGDRETQHTWISLAPTSETDGTEIDLASLRSDDEAPWSTVVNQLVTAPTQFKDEIFWRVRRVVRELSPKDQEIYLIGRDNNRFGSEDNWHRDYRVKDHQSYAIMIETHSPGAHGHAVPGDATLSTVDDTDALIRIPANPTQIRPNQTRGIKFSVEPINTLATRYSGLELATQVPNWTSPYPRGSLCLLTLNVAKGRLRMFVSGGFGILAVVAVAVATMSLKSKDYTTVGIATAVAAVLGFIAHYAWTREIKK